MMRRVALTRPSPRLVAAGLTGVMALLWTAIEAGAATLALDYAPLQVVWVRYGVHLLALLLVLAPRHGAALVRTRRPALQVGHGLLMLVMPISFLAAVAVAPVSDVLAVFWLAPVLLLAGTTILLGERPRWPVWGAALLSVLGAQLILRPSRMGLAAALAGLVMSASFSVYVVLTRSLRTEWTATNLLYSAAAVFAPLTPVMASVWRWPTPHDALVMAAVGLAGLGVLWALDRACALAPVSTIALLVPLQLVSGVVVMGFATGVWPSRWGSVGMTLIAGAAVAGWLMSAPRGIAAPARQCQAGHP